MTMLVMFMVLAAAGVIQSLFPALIVFNQARPPFLVAVVVFYAVYFPAPVLAVAALTAGVLYDANSLLPLGGSALYYCLAGALIRKHQSFWREAGGGAMALLTALIAVGHPMILWFAGMTFRERGGVIPGGWMRHGVAIMLMGAPAGVLILRVATRLHRMTGTLEEVVNP